jgi:hypothetical protein
MRLERLKVSSLLLLEILLPVDEEKVLVLGEFALLSILSEAVLTSCLPCASITELTFKILCFE